MYQFTGYNINNLSLSDDSLAVFFSGYYSWLGNDNMMICKLKLNLPTVSTSQIFESGINVYPNPLQQDILTVDLSATSSKVHGQLIVSDVWGRLRVVKATSAAENVQELNLSALENGVYFLTVQNELKRLVTKLIISR